MLKITKKVEYALIALKHMSHKEGETLTSARELCEAYSMPFDTMAKVLQAMNQAGWLTSLKGIKGGYTLSSDLTQISFMQLTRAIEGQEAADVCMGNKGMCELHGTCNIVTPVTQLHKHVTSFLENLNIDQLLTSGPTLPIQAWQYEGKSDGI